MGQVNDGEIDDVGSDAGFRMLKSKILTVLLNTMETMVLTRGVKENGSDNLHWPIQRFHLDFYRTQVSLGSDLWVRLSLTERGFVDLTDVTLADEDTNSTLTDNANRAFQGNVAT